MCVSYVCPCMLIYVLCMSCAYVTQVFHSPHACLTHVLFILLLFVRMPYACFMGVVCMARGCLIHASCMPYVVLISVLRMMSYGCLMSAQHMRLHVSANFMCEP